MTADERTPDEILGANVKRHRERLHLTQKELAERLSEDGWELDGTAVTRIEKGTRAVKVNQLPTLAKALRVQPSSLVADESDKLKEQWFRAGRDLKKAREHLIGAMWDVTGLHRRLSRDDGPAVLESLRLAEGHIKQPDDLLDALEMRARDEVRESIGPPVNLSTPEGAALAARMQEIANLVAQDICDSVTLRLADGVEQEVP